VRSNVKLTYSRAIVSFCPDLTSRDAGAVPVGVFLVGDTNGEGLASLLVPRLRGLRVDEITREVLMSVPDLLRLHVEEVLSENVNLPAAEILRRLHEKLRNTLFVSDISEERMVELDEPLAASLQQLLADEYDAAVGRQGEMREDVSQGGASHVAGRGAGAREPGESMGLGGLPEASYTFRTRSPGHAHAYD
jgi:hypothetical protein